MVFTDNVKIMSTYGQRLKEARKDKKLSQAALAKEVGVKQPTIAELESEGKGSSHTPLIAKVLGVSPIWLANGTGDKYLPTPNQDSNTVQSELTVETPNFFNYKLNPVVGTAQLGDDGYWAELEYPPGHGDGYIEYPSRDPGAYALRCRGNSMKPRIKDGEFVIVEPSRECINGDDVLVKCKKGRVMVKELLYIRDGEVHLGSINESYGKIIIKQVDIELMHYVAGIAKKALWRPE